jgi:hypothetical protein
MRSHHKLILVLMAAGVVAVAYAANRQSTDMTPMPSQSRDIAASVNQGGAPQASASVQEAPLSQSANKFRSAGEELAEHAQFTATKACVSRADKVRILELKRQQCAATNANAAPAECQSLPEESRALNAALSKSDCATDPVRLQEDLTRATASAARAGDADAQLCFVDGGYFPTEKSDIEAYGAEAASYVKARMAAGDWRMVQTLATPPNSISHRGQSLAGQVNIGLPFTAYRATRLLQYGAEGSYSQLLDLNAKSLSRSLTPAQVANADEWAKEEFNRHFSGSGKLDKSPATCLAE